MQQMAMMQQQMAMMQQQLIQQQQMLRFGGKVPPGALPGMPMQMPMQMPMAAAGSPALNLGTAASTPEGAFDFMGKSAGPGADAFDFVGDEISKNKRVL